MNNKDNGKEKKIFDGCKFCMEIRGFKCDKAEELFNHPSILSSYSPDNCLEDEKFVSKKPFEFPLQCYGYGPALLRFCECCQIVYRSRVNVFSHTLNETCPHCGNAGVPISDIYQDTYGIYYEEDDYYTAYFPRCPYVDGLGCEYNNSERCGKECIFHPYHIYGSKTLTSVFATPEELKEYNLDCLELAESIFCGQQHPTHEEEYQKAIDFLRHYEADDAYRLTPCYGNCDGMCELCPIDGREKEYVFNDIEGRLNYIKESLQCEKIHLCSLYADLLDITLVLNQVADGRFDKFVSLIREVCVRMDKGEADDCVALVVSLFETAKALTKVDKSYMKSKG